LEERDGVDMASDRLYEVAMQYKKTKLWQELPDDALFGVRLPDGEIGYCSVMGWNREHIALGVYCGTAGLDTYRMLAGVEEDTQEAEMIWRAFSQNCLQCSFERKDELFPEELEEARNYGKKNRISFRGSHAFPRFVKHLPYCYPMPIKKPEEEEILIAALMAAIEVTGMMGAYVAKEVRFTTGTPYDREIPLLEWDGKRYRKSMIPLPEPLPVSFVSPRISNELLAGKVKRARKKGELVCELILLPTPMTDADANGQETLCMPVMLLAANPESGMIFPNTPVMDFPTGNGALLTEFAEILLREKAVPKTILVRSERTHVFLARFCKQTGIRLELDDSGALDGLDDLEEEFYEDVAQGAHAEEGGEIPSMISFVLETLEQLSDRELKALPREMKSSIRQILGTGVLPSALEERLEKILR